MFVLTNYISGGIWRGLIGVFILVERYNKGVEVFGEVCLEFLY